MTPYGQKHTLYQRKAASRFSAKTSICWCKHAGLPLAEAIVGDVLRQLLDAGWNWGRCGASKRIGRTHALELMGYDPAVDLVRLIYAAKRLPALIGHDSPSQIVEAGRRLDLHPPPADLDAIGQRVLERPQESRGQVTW